MDDTNETIADISAELRHNSRGLMFYFRNEENGSTHAMGVDYIELADRLDAALKRERGDCAKLREALKAIGELCDGLMPTWDGAIGRIKDIAEIALAAPPRNCDRFATKFEAKHEWEKVCKAGLPEQGPFEDWIFYPATEKEGGAK